MSTEKMLYKSCISTQERGLSVQKTRHADGTRRNRSAPPLAVDSARCRPRQPRALRVSPIFRRATPSPCHLEGAADRSGPRFAGRGGGRHGAESRRIDGPRRLVKSPAAPHHQGDAGSHRGNRPDALFADQDRPLTLEETPKLHTDVQCPRTITILKQLAILVLANAQATNLSSVPSSHRRMRTTLSHAPAARL